jgi:hypothetical protein
VDSTMKSQKALLALSTLSINSARQER